MTIEVGEVGLAFRDLELMGHRSGLTPSEVVESAGVYQRVLARNQITGRELEEVAQRWAEKAKPDGWPTVGELVRLAEALRVERRSMRSVELGREFERLLGLAQRAFTGEDAARGLDQDDIFDQLAGVRYYGAGGLPDYVAAGLRAVGGRPGLARQGRAAMEAFVHAAVQTRRALPQEASMEGLSKVPRPKLVLVGGREVPASDRAEPPKQIEQRREPSQIEQRQRGGGMRSLGDVLRMPSKPKNTSQD